MFTVRTVSGPTQNGNFLKFIVHQIERIINLFNL